MQWELDAMGTQKDIAEQILDKEAHYVLALKGNQGKFFESIKTYILNISRLFFDPQFYV